jgi:restriction system protein
MTIPKYQELMLPLLKLTKSKKDYSLRQSHDDLAKEFKLTDEELRELLPSGKQPVFLNRVGWAKTYLVKAAILESTGRGTFRITPRGLEILKSPPKLINANYLKQFEEFAEFKEKSSQDILTQHEHHEQSDETPEETLEKSYQIIKLELANDLLNQVKKATPFFFEQIVVDLLVAMGYGGSHKDAGKALQKSHDSGIDGIIKEDKLGLDVIYIQAKRWENTVGRPEIQAFAGSLEGYRAKKGVFITTSDFSKQAYDYIQRIEKKIILIDGNMLTELMIDHNVGVSEVERYILKKIDTDYFEEA